MICQKLMSKRHAKKRRHLRYVFERGNINDDGTSVASLKSYCSGLHQWYMGRTTVSHSLKILFRNDVEDFILDALVVLIKMNNWKLIEWSWPVKSYATNMLKDVMMNQSDCVFVIVLKFIDSFGTHESDRHVILLATFCYNGINSHMIRKLWSSVVGRSINVCISWTGIVLCGISLQGSVSWKKKKKMFLLSICVCLFCEKFVGLIVRDPGSMILRFIVVQLSTRQIRNIWRLTVLYGRNEMYREVCQSSKWM